MVARSHLPRDLQNGVHTICAPRHRLNLVELDGLFRLWDMGILGHSVLESGKDRGWGGVEDHEGQGEEYGEWRWDVGRYCLRGEDIGMETGCRGVGRVRWS